MMDVRSRASTNPARPEIVTIAAERTYERSVTALDAEWPLRIRIADAWATGHAFCHALRNGDGVPVAEQWYHLMLRRDSYGHWMIFNYQQVTGFGVISDPTVVRVGSIILRREQIQQAMQAFDENTELSRVFLVTSAIEPDPSLPWALAQLAASSILLDSPTTDVHNWRQTLDILRKIAASNNPLRYQADSAATTLIYAAAADPRTMDTVRGPHRSMSVDAAFHDRLNADASAHDRCECVAWAAAAAKRAGVAQAQLRSLFPPDLRKRLEQLVAF